MAARWGTGQPGRPPGDTPWVSSQPSLPAGTGSFPTLSMPANPSAKDGKRQSEAGSQPHGPGRPGLQLTCSFGPPLAWPLGEHAGEKRRVRCSSTLEECSTSRGDHVERGNEPNDGGTGAKGPVEREQAASWRRRYLMRRESAMSVEETGTPLSPQGPAQRRVHSSHTGNGLMG